MRVVVELRRDAEPDKVLKDLQRRTALQSNFGAILLALVNGQPQQLSLRQLLQTFLDYRELTLIRRTSHALRKTEDRLEVVEGLITALNNLQAVIAMIQEAQDAGSARASLMVRLDLNERQADAVLAMPLRRLTGSGAGKLAPRSRQPPRRARAIEIAPRKPRSVARRHG
jgi:DNA gyrase subunit A